MSFATATRLKYRFKTQRGLVSTEDLWDLPLTGVVSLNTIAKTINRAIKAEEEEDFVSTKSKADTTLIAMLDIVRSVIDFKKNEKARRLKRSTNKAKRERLLGILARKEDADDENQSKAALRRMIEELED